MCDVVENWVGHFDNKFYYCREHKVECAVLGCENKEVSSQDLKLTGLAAWIPHGAYPVPVVNMDDSHNPVWEHDKSAFKCTWCYCLEGSYFAHQKCSSVPAAGAPVPNPQSMNTMPIHSSHIMVLTNVAGVKNCAYCGAREDSMKAHFLCGGPYSTSVPSQKP